LMPGLHPLVHWKCQYAKLIRSSTGLMYCCLAVPLVYMPSDVDRMTSDSTLSDFVSFRKCDLVGSAWVASPSTKQQYLHNEMPRSMVRDSGRLAICVPSMDPNEEIWPIFFKLFAKYWPNCRPPVYLINNSRSFSYPKVNVISVGEEVSWSANLLKGMEMIPESQVLIVLDDYFLRSTVDSDRIDEFADYMASNDIGTIRLKSSRYRTQPHMGRSDLEEIPKGTAYRTSLQASLWNKKTLEYLLKRVVTAWDFETRGTSLSCKLQSKFLCLSRSRASPIDYANALVKGRITKDAIALLERENIAFSSKTIPVQKWHQSDNFYRFRRLANFPMDYGLSLLGTAKDCRSNEKKQ